MLRKLNHIAIAVPNLAEAVKKYRDVLGCKVSDPQQQPDHGVTTVFIDLGNTKIELLEPLGADSPIVNFLKRNPEGGIHHLCIEVDDAAAVAAKLATAGIRILGDGKPKTGAHGKPVIFLHPKDLAGTLIELEQA